MRTLIAALVIVLATPASARPVYVQDVPDSLYVRAFKRAVAVKPGAKSCKRSIGPLLAGALYRRCAQSSPRTNPVCGPADPCEYLLSELRAICPGSVVDGVPCVSEPASSAAR